MDIVGTAQLGGVRRARRCLLPAPTYENRELIVLDDGNDAVDDLIPPDPSIRYERLPKKIPLGAKLNLACEMARGDVPAHFDDDWYAPWRIAYQVEALAARGGSNVTLPIDHRPRRAVDIEGNRIGDARRRFLLFVGHDGGIDIGSPKSPRKSASTGPFRTSC